MASRLVHEQSLDRKKQLFKNALRFQESAAGVVVQRVTGSYLYRILTPLRRAREAQARASGTVLTNPMAYLPDASDPLVHAIYNMDNTFADCRSKAVDMMASVEAVADEWKVHGASGHGCLLLAWKTTFDSSTKKIQAPVLVGAMTLHRFVRTGNFSTDHSTGAREGSLGDRDHDVLRGEQAAGDGSRRNYFNRNTMYIDCLCAKGRGGVGKLMILHAIRWAIMRKCTGVIALSYVRKAKQVPESHAAFVALRFDKIIPTVQYKIQGMHGSWFYLALDNVGFEAILKEGVDICARTGLTDRTKDSLIWRCPN